MTEFRDADHWRWELIDPVGVRRAEHEVDLGHGEPDYEGFVDLAGFLRRRADPDRRLASEAVLVDRVGAWIGHRVFGPIGEVLADAEPVVVQVEVLEGAEVLLDRPLELGHAHGRPLARREVSLVFAPPGPITHVAKAPVDDRLRLLAVYSLPIETGALAIRRERYELTQLLRRVASRHRRAVEWRVLQYGVTRGRLKEVLEEGDGWDVVHFSGHGLAGGLLLEHTDGSPDLVATEELVGLLAPSRRRLRLVSLSSCVSAAASVVDARRWLQLPVPKELEAAAAADANPEDPELTADTAQHPEAHPEVVGDRRAPLPTLAAELVRQLDCAVLAMRYPVADEFAITLSEGLYEQLLGRGQPLVVALQRALLAAAGTKPTTAAPALSIATPTMVGPLAVDLRLPAPPAPPGPFDVRATPMAVFPEEPTRFVGRAGPMARASAALAPANPHVGVLLHGMAGAGKTACALELAYRHEQAFEALAFWQAPTLDDPDSIAPALVNLAMAMEAQLPGLAMVHAVGDRTELARFLPRLSELLERRAVLLVLDNLESLLTAVGGWRDPRWRQLVDALTSHRGESRVVLTSRVRPQGLDERVLVEPVHALSLDEALLLARELPNLGALLRGDASLPQEQGRKLVRRTLRVVQGHPKLVELADALASDPQVLATQLAAADVATTTAERDRLATFFAQGQTGLAEDHFVRVLDKWTRQALQTLPEASAMLFGVLCCLEDPDRTERVVATVWPHVWPELGQPGEAPGLAVALAHLVGSGLVAGEGDPVSYRIHPGVAGAGREHAGSGVQQVVDRVLADFWQQLFGQAMEAEGGEAGGPLLRAGRSAAPYLLRLEEWTAAGRLLEQVLRRDQSPGTVQAVLPLMRRIAQGSRGSDDELAAEVVLARALNSVAPEAAEEQLREVLERAMDQQRFDVASGVAGDLVNLLWDTGRLQEALAVVEQLPDLTRRAGFGPWTQLADQVQRLQLLTMMGRDEEVLAEVQAFRAQMATLPEQSDQEERVPPWNVREVVLDAGTAAASHLGRWQEALTFNADQVRSKQGRGATDHEVAWTRFNDYGPLLQLGQLNKAERLLLACWDMFEAEGDLGMLGKTLVALADLEARRGHPGEAVRFSQTALRYAYAASDSEAVAVSHNNLSIYLQRAGQDPALILAHRLAAALIRHRTGSGRLAVTLAALARDLVEAGDPAPLPGSFAELCDRVGQVEGVRLAELADRLPRKASDDQALAELVQLARAL